MDRSTGNCEKCKRAALHNMCRVLEPVNEDPTEDEEGNRVEGKRIKYPDMDLETGKQKEDPKTGDKLIRDGRAYGPRQPATCGKFQKKKVSK